MAMIVLLQSVASTELVFNARTGDIVAVKDAGLAWQNCSSSRANLRQMCSTRAYLCDCKGKDGISHNGPGCETSKYGAALDGQDAADKRNFQEGRDHIENEGGEHEVDATCAPVNHTRQGTSLAGDMEGQIQVMKMDKHSICNLANGALGHLQSCHIGNPSLVCRREAETASSLLPGSGCDNFRQCLELLLGVPRALDSCPCQGPTQADACSLLGGHVCSGS